MQGWIKLHRKILDNVVFQNANLFQVWCWCLMRANHTETKILWNGKEVTLNTGQFISGRIKGSKECNMKSSTFRNQISLLKKLGNLDTKSDSKYTLFTVVKWNQYQHLSEMKDSEKDSQRTAKGHRQECKNEKKNTISLIPENIYRIYAGKIKSGGKSDAIKSIAKLLNDGKTEVELLRCIDNYACALPKENKFRIQANNFFGSAERYKDFINVEQPRAISTLPVLKAGFPDWK